MKNATIKYALVLSVFILGSNFSAKAQIGNIGEIIRAGQADATLLAEAYVNPYATGFGNSLNSGWFQTAGTHGLLGFDITLSTTFAVVPSTDEQFNVRNLEPQFEAIEVYNNVYETPTIAGEAATRTEFVISGDNSSGVPRDQLPRFTMPDGSGFGYVPAPALQISKGLPKGIDLSLRYIPKVGVDDVGDISLFGFAVKHDILQWIPGLGMLPIDVSAQFGYTSLSANSAGISVLPPDAYFNGNGNYSNSGQYDRSDFDGQKVETTTSGWTANVLVGKNLSLVAFGVGAYAGVGIQSSTMELDVAGNYPVESPDPTIQNPNQKRLEVLSDPINLDLENGVSPNLMAGVNIDITLIRIAAQYSYGDYSMGTVSVGIAF